MSRFERERESNFSQPITLSQNGIVPKVQRPNKKRGLIVLVSLIVLAAVVVGMFFLLRSSNDVGDNGVTNAEVLELSKDSYAEIAAAQSILIKGVQGNLETSEFFTDAARDRLEDIVITFQDFNQRINQYNSDLLSDDYARESFLSLREAMNHDTPSYMKLIDTYNLFYDYVNSGYQLPYAEKIIELDDPGMSLALANLDNVVERTGGYEAGTVVYDIFNASLGEDYPRVYYYELVGGIIAGVENEE